MSTSSCLARELGITRQKADSTLRYSQAVPDPSTNRALSRLTSEVRRDPVHSTRYGRQRISICDTHCPALLSSCWGCSALLEQPVSSKVARQRCLAFTAKAPVVQPRPTSPPCLCPGLDSRLAHFMCGHEGVAMTCVHACNGICSVEYDLGRTRASNPRFGMAVSDCLHAIDPV